MSRFTFVHAADLHLDTPFEGVGRVSPEIAEALRDSSLWAWDALVDLCLEQHASVLLLAGDIYDGDVRGVRSQIRFLRGLERLAERGIQVFVAHGNHDPTDGRWSAIQGWPRGVTIFSHDRVQSVPVLHEGHHIAVVHGISHRSREVSDNLALGFRRGPEPCAHLAVLHCNVDRDSGHALYSPCTLDDLRRTGIDYWALGHIHAQRVLSSGETWAVYPGCLQGRSLKPSEQGVKGAFVGTIEQSRISAACFVPVPHVRFVEVVVDVAGVADMPGLVNRLEGEAASEVSSAATRGLVIRARLTGRGAIHTDLRVPGATEELLRILREEAIGQRPFVWWCAVRDQTQAELDRDGILRRGDFSAELIGLVAALRADEERLARFVGDQTGDLAPHSLQRWSRDISADARGLLDDAETLALELLETRSES